VIVKHGGNSLAGLTLKNVSVLVLFDIKVERFPVFSHCFEKTDVTVFLRSSICNIFDFGSSWGNLNSTKRHDWDIHLETQGVERVFRIICLIDSCVELVNMLLFNTFSVESTDNTNPRLECNASIVHLLGKDGWSVISFTIDSGHFKLIFEGVSFSFELSVS
jgi:hypothetical protein